MAECERKLRSVNEPVTHVARTAKEIETLQRDYFVMIRALCKLLRMRPKTKQHNAVFHLGSSLHHFSTVRDTDKDENETRNKEERSMWSISNQQKKDIASTTISTLLSKWRVDEESVQNERCDDAHREGADHVLHDVADGVRVTTSKYLTVPPRLDAPERLQHDALTEQGKMTAQLQWALGLSDDVESGLSLALTKKKPVEAPESLLWTPLRRLSQIVISTSLEWEPTQIFAQTLHFTEMPASPGRWQSPGVAYRLASDNEIAPLRVGVACAALRAANDRRPSSRRCHDLVVVLRLNQCEPAVGNEKMVKEYGHRRLQHAMDDHSSRVVVDVVSSVHLTREVVLIPDLHYARKQFGAGFQLVYALHCRGKERAEMKYFEVRTVQLSSAPMRTLNSGILLQRELSETECFHVSGKDASDDESSDSGILDLTLA